MRRKVNILTSIDWFTIILYLLLVTLGWINIYAAVFDEEHFSIIDVSQRYGKQLMWIIAAIIIAFVIMLIDGRVYMYFSYFIYGALILILIFVLIFGNEVHGAKSWISFGNINIQPAEFAKFATGLTLANYLSTYNLKIHNLKSLGVLFLIIFLPATLILLQNDTGSALVYFAFILPVYREGLSGAVLFFAFAAILLFLLALVINGLIIIIALIALAFLAFLFISKNVKQTILSLFIYLGFILTLILIDRIFTLNISNYYIVIISLSLSAAIYFIVGYFKKIRSIYFIVLFLFIAIGYTFTVNYAFDNILEKHQQRRISILLGIESDPLGYGYNVNQSKIAIGSGGLTGKGFLEGTQTKFNFVPEQSTDFIFCTVGEEWGFVGSTIVIGLFLLLLLRLEKLAERQRSQFNRIYGYCVVSILFFHIAVNIGMSVGLVPVIGIPLPFFSYGGSSLWAFTIMLFIFLKIDANRMESL